jgi:hypothetical protein
MSEGVPNNFRIPFLRTAIFGLLMAFATRSQSNPLEQWHWRNPLPQGNQLYHIASANGTFVAAGELGTILTSADGTNWITRDSGTTFELHGCTYGAGKYIAVGEFGTVVTSTDLVSWTPQYTGTFNNLNAVIYTNSQFVAVGDGGTIVTSPDGVFWTSRASGSWQLFDITYSAGTYVAVGGTFPTSSSTGIGVIITSPDAVVWTLRNPVTNPYFSVTYGQGMFAAVGGANGYGGAAASIWTSTDTTNWTPVGNLPSSAFSLTKIAYAQGEWLVGQGNLFGNVPYYLAFGAIYSSSDLESLSLVASNSAPIQGFALANGKLIAEREDGTLLISSDGLTWTNPLPEPAALIFRDLKYLNGSFVGIGNNMISFSPDGITWTNSIPDTNGLLSITYGNGRYVGGGDFRTVWTSTDGINWSNPAPDIGIFPYLAETHVAFGNGIFVGASGYNGDLLASPDGLAWTVVQQVTNQPNYTYFADVAFGAGRFIAVSSTAIASSTDGTNWSVVGVSNELDGVAAGNGTFVAVGPDIVMTSSDGTNWNTQTSMQFGLLTKVAFGGGFFVAVTGQPYYAPVYSESGIWISRDGLHWAKRDSNTVRGLSTVAFGNGTFVIGGDRSLILQSDPIVNLSLAINGAPHLFIDGPTNRGFRLEYRDGLNASIQWSFLTNITLSGNAADFIDVTATNSPMRFYRALLLP